MVSDSKRLQISLSKQSTKRLEDVSKETGLTKSVIIELALNDYFKRKGNQIKA